MVKYQCPACDNEPKLASEWNKITRKGIKHDGRIMNLTEESKKCGEWVCPSCNHLCCGFDIITVEEEE